MKWDLEERLEDAFVGYLRTELSGTTKVTAAFDYEVPQYPMVAVLVEGLEPISDPAEWHDARKCNVAVACMTENADQLDAAGAVITTARERARSMRSDVMNALAVETLKDLLVAVGITDLAISGAQVAGVVRSVEAGAMVSTIMVECWVEPVAGSGE